MQVCSVGAWVAPTQNMCTSRLRHAHGQATAPGWGLHWGPVFLHAQEGASRRGPDWLPWSSQSYCCGMRTETRVCPPSSPETPKTVGPSPGVREEATGSSDSCKAGWRHVWDSGMREEEHSPGACLG